MGALVRSLALLDSAGRALEEQLTETLFGTQSAEFWRLTSDFLAGSGSELDLRAHPLPVQQYFALHGRTAAEGRWQAASTSQSQFLIDILTTSVRAADSEPLRSLALNRLLIKRHLQVLREAFADE